MDIDKIMLKLQKEHCNIFANARRKFAFDEKAHYDMRNYLAGYDHCYEMLEQLIEEDKFKISEERVSELINMHRKIIGQTPPCTGSSVQKQSKLAKLEPSITKESVPASKVEFKANGDMVFIGDIMTDIYKNTPPTNEQVFDKINEIIDVINKL